MPKKRSREQEDVLEHKDHVTRSSIGLQQWGDEATPEGPGPRTGTAARAARIKRERE